MLTDLVRNDEYEVVHSCFVSYYPALADIFLHGNIYEYSELICETELWLHTEKINHM